MVALAKKNGISTVCVSMNNSAEAALIEDITIYPIASMAELVGHLRGELTVAPYESDRPFTDSVDTLTPSTDLAYIKGQEHVKRALEVAAAGGHNLIITGPPGSGKTLLARSLPTILPRMTPEEALEVPKIYRITGLLPSDTPW